jgi:heme exporter protein D
VVTVATVVTHAVATWFLTGLIWTVQVVHYPLFAAVGPDAFAAYEAEHATRIGRLLAVPWALQGATTGLLLLWVPAGVPPWLVWLAAGLAATPVAVTVLLSVPAHRALGAGFDARIHRRLVATNWIRTLAWTAHGAVATAIVLRSLGA